MVPPPRLRCAGRPQIVLSDDIPRNADDMAAGLSASARAPRHRTRQRPAGGIRLGSRREALRRRRDLQVGHGLPRLHLYRCGAPGWRDLPPLGEPRLGPLCRAAIDGRHGLLGQRAAGRARPRAPTAKSTSSSPPTPRRGTGCPSPRTRPHWWYGTSSMTGTPRWRHPSPSSGSARPRRRRPARGGPAGRGGPAADRSGRLRRRQPRHLLQFSRPETPNTFLPRSTGQRWARRRRTVRSSGRGRSGPTRRSSWRSRPPGPLLELLAGESLVETIDYAAHQSSINGHQAVVDDDGVAAHRHRPRRSRGRQLA